MTAQFFLPLATYPHSSSGLIVSNALTFAEYCGASLHVCAIRVEIPHIPGAWSSLLLDTSEMIENAEALSRDRAATLIAAATNLGANAKIQLFTREVKARLPQLHDAAATEARFFDLAILERIADVPDTRIIAEAVIFGSGRPTVIFPNRTLAGPIDHLVIAWDGSRAAARAVSDAGPLIHKARRVSVLSVVGEKSLPETSGARLAKNLGFGRRRRSCNGNPIYVIFHWRKHSTRGARTGCRYAGDGRFWTLKIARLRPGRSYRRRAGQSSLTRSHITLTSAA